MICIGKSGARSSGPTGCPVPGCSTGGGGEGRSAARLYQASGRRLSSRTYLTLSLMLLLLGRAVSPVSHAVERSSQSCDGRVPGTRRRLVAPRRPQRTRRFPTCAASAAPPPERGDKLAADGCALDAGRPRVRLVPLAARADGGSRRRAPRADGAGRAGRRREGGRAAPLPREAHRPRADRPARRPRNRLPRAERARGLGALRRRRAVGGDRHRDRRRRRPAVRDRRERRDGQGRLVLPADGEEAPARAGDRAPEPPAVHLPRGLRRRLPPAPGRGLPRPRPLRAHLLQPGAPVGARDPADRVGHGLLHRRRRVRPGHVRRDGDRPRHRDDLHRRPAAREGRDRTGRVRRGARRSGRPHAPLGRRRPLRDLGRARARDRPADRAAPRPASALPLAARAAGAARARPGRPVRPRPGGLPPRARRARGDRPPRRRLALRASSSSSTATR